ncbi:ATP synthase subunit a [Gemmobacter aquaticus]|uniref:ATP synthase subunit a n=1 Tax=Gemmobacter aquaticus TaxID=490185 RepID=A0A917YMN7_9RHOB|nr:ATP synthase subunit a [Gemmobacter aquaticus]
MAETGFAIHPMDQFIVKPIFREIEPGTCVPAEDIYEGCIKWYEITNVTVWMALAVLAIVALMVFGSAGRATIPSRIQSVCEMIYGFIYKMVEDVTGHDGVKYFPYVMTLFLFILFSNLLGLLPMSFTTTSHVAVTVTLALLVFLGVTILGLVKNGIGFLGMFWVSSAPLALRPVLAIIEVISYFVRPVSHSIRLAGNLMAGHAVMKVFAGFASMAVISPVAVGAVTAIYGLELLVAVVQAYVFTILTCVYLKDAVGGAHH